ncbi:ferrochelatase 2 [Actinidia rufa]|uniref:Ferrochelatase 2 n=1 Tax=Actinidia rufa TaxID=165716 RepID=A0A7J0H6K2_9ERIC|nr:ferrochelatase 2 [Actinidia rufa]
MLKNLLSVGLIKNSQAEELRKALCAKNVPAKVYVGMRYWHPFTEEAIEQIKRDGITKLVVLPLYPQFSISTSGSSLRLLEGIFREDEYLVNMQHTVIPSWYQREGYIKAMANLIEKELGNFDYPEKASLMLVGPPTGFPVACRTFNENRHRSTGLAEAVVVAGTVGLLVAVEYGYNCVS